jgi:20S proteasome alpha/beta subunit
MEAVKQGSATVGLKSNTHAVVVALKRASSELSGKPFIIYTPFSFAYSTEVASVTHALSCLFVYNINLFYISSSEKDPGD